MESDGINTITLHKLAAKRYLQQSTEHILFVNIMMIRIMMIIIIESSLV